MILKKIKLNNIRSYEDVEIELTGGSTLLWGDIGAGKTSILLAIEFALFGLQPGQRGGMLLKNGKEEGGVKIDFEIDEKYIEIERTLKRGKSISQDYSSITIDGEKKEISVSELKTQVLELLNYPKEFSKKQNLLYRFTVYTPQEEMKQIILQDSNTRLNTLRHVFGVDKYKKIIENITIIATKIRERKRLKEGMIANLESDKQVLQGKKENLKLKNIRLSQIEGELLLKTDSREKLEKEKKEIELQMQEKNKLQQEIEKTKILISTKEQLIFDNKKSTEQLKNQIQESSSIIFDESQILDLDKQLNSINLNKSTFAEKNLEINSEIHALNLKNQENENTKNKVTRLDMCPTCLQDVDSVYKSNVANQLDTDISQNSNRVKELTLEKQDINKKLLFFEQEVTEVQKKISELNLAKVKLEGIKEKQIRVEGLEKQTTSLLGDIQILASQMDSLKDSIFDLSKYDNLFQTKQIELREARQQERMTEISVAELKKEIHMFSLQIEEFKKRIEKTEEIKQKLIYLTNLETWISKKFTPIIAHIEKNVMIKLKLEFSELFAQWFSMLVSDNFNVHLSDDFSPIIEQQDYEIDYAYLSGGERTAIALAYRLSLNQVINSLLSKIKTKDLVILDEPTDGFSDQQLDKMRDILQQLNLAQLIIVSHEQKIEGFVENVIKLQKENGLSRKE